jgi:hypothetical protein
MEREPPEVGLALTVTFTLAALAVVTSLLIEALRSSPEIRLEQATARAAAARKARDAGARWRRRGMLDDLGRLTSVFMATTYFMISVLNE